MKPIFKRLTELGASQRRAEFLPQVALEVAQAAKQGVINADDARDIYMAYYMALPRHRPPSPDSIKANASKIRQLIKCKDPALLRRVIRMHRSVGQHHKVKPLYHVMVDACRLKGELQRAPTETQLTRLIRRPRD
jgi:hypothetical protein